METKEQRVKSNVLKYSMYGRIYDVYTLYDDKPYCILVIQ